MKKVMMLIAAVMIMVLGIGMSVMAASKEDEKDTIAPLYRNDPLPDSDEPRIERIRCANVYIFGPKYASGGAGCALLPSQSRILYILIYCKNP